jgi:hypothetical protein
VDVITHQVPLQYPATLLVRKLMEYFAQLTPQRTI